MIVGLVLSGSFINVLVNYDSSDLIPFANGGPKRLETIDGEL
jgi:hypothetical protein